jgi:hypothetical protein
VEGKGRVKEGRRKGRERTVGGGSVGERYPPGEGAESKPGAKTMDGARSGSGACYLSFPVHLVPLELEQLGLWTILF